MASDRSACSAIARRAASAPAPRLDASPSVAWLRENTYRPLRDWRTDVRFAQGAEASLRLYVRFDTPNKSKEQTHGLVSRRTTSSAADILRERLPELKVRVVNVVDLMRLQPDTEHPHGLSNSEFDSLFTSSRPSVF